MKKVPRPGYKPANVKSRQKAKDETEFISRYQDEYDPIKPNEFSRYLRRRREGKHKVTRYAEQKKSQERDYKRQNPQSDSDSSEDEEKSKRQKAMGMGKVSERHLLLLTAVFSGNDRPAISSLYRTKLDAEHASSEESRFGRAQ